MARALIAAFFLSFIIPFIVSPHAYAADSSLSLSLIRAVRISDTSISLSFKTDEEATASVAYTDADGSKLTLTDSVPQVDHLFTLNQLDPKHGYSFVLSARTESSASNIYTVLLAPESIGGPGARIVPGVQETTASGDIVATTLSASTTPTPITAVPWWVFAALFVLVVGWILYGKYRSQPLQQPYG